MPAPSYLALPHVLQLFRYDQQLTRQQTARIAGMCPHCYEAIEAGRAQMSKPGLEALYVRLPVIGVLMADMALTLSTELEIVARRLRTVIRALENLDTQAQAVEIARVALDLQWREQGNITPAESR
ncbi:MAG: hypothetical protein H7338_07140 [Candidatus Sericytochromatia bacterium]|nr:hypothetical protein [Candidatus Sericytochromatia bacterium]